MHGIRFERHEGSGYPLRAVYPDGSWLAVNRDGEGLYAGDARGRIVQLLGSGEFNAKSPREFVLEYRRAFGTSLRARAGKGRASSQRAGSQGRAASAGKSSTPAPPRDARPSPPERGSFPGAPPAPPRASRPSLPEPGSSLSDQLFGEPPIADPWQNRDSSMSAPPSSAPPRGRLRGLLYPDPARTGSLALLLVRLSAGLLLMPHGVYKLLGGAKGLAAGLASRGAPAPIALAWCATLAEAVGGLLVAIGLLTRPAAAAACVTMVVAWSTSHLGDAIRIGTAKGGVFEYPLLLSVLFLTIALAGPGRYSVDARI